MKINKMEYLYEGSRRSGKSYYQNLLNEKDKEIKRLNSKYNKALELLQDFNMPCECADCKIPDNYCEEYCTDDSECYKKCWDMYIELKLKETNK